LAACSKLDCSKTSNGNPIPSSAYEHDMGQRKTHIKDWLTQEFVCSMAASKWFCKWQSITIFPRKSSSRTWSTIAAAFWYLSPAVIATTLRPNTLDFLSSFESRRLLLPLGSNDSSMILIHTCLCNSCFSHKLPSQKKQSLWHSVAGGREDPRFQELLSLITVQNSASQTANVAEPFEAYKSI